MWFTTLHVLLIYYKDTPECQMGKWQASTAQNPLSFSNSFFLFSAFSLEYVCVCTHVCVFACSCTYSVTSDSLQLQTVAHQAPLSMGCPRQEYWSRLPFCTLSITPTSFAPPCIGRSILYQPCHLRSLGCGIAYNFWFTSWQNWVPCLGIIKLSFVVPCSLWSHGL